MTDLAPEAAAGIAITELLAGFIQELRQAGLPVSLSENIDAMEAVKHIPLEDREAFKYALAATLVNAVSSAILASIGLEVLGLGPIDSPTLGMTLYWVNFNAAMINGWWWWWTAPTVIILMGFLGLFFLTVGLDEIAKPRLRRSA